MFAGGKIGLKALTCQFERIVFKVSIIRLDVYGPTMELPDNNSRLDGQSSVDLGTLLVCKSLFDSKDINSEVDIVNIFLAFVYCEEAYDIRHRGMSLVSPEALGIEVVLVVFFHKNPIFTTLPMFAGSSFFFLPSFLQ